MKLHPLHLALASLALFTGGAQAQGHAHGVTRSNASMASQYDPFAPVYLVTSAATFRSQLQAIATDGAARRDSIGTELVVSRINAHQLPDVAQRIHENENRCGGFFAFDSRAAADQFIRSERTAQSLSAASLVPYTIDNAATVNPWLTAVDAARIKDTIIQLSSYTNRYYSAPTGKTSAESIKSNWDALAAGRSDVSSELFACSNCSTQPSVILTVQGSELPNEIVVLGAHLDSINGSAGGSSTQVAPGADDDASGIATLTEVLRVSMANGWRPRRTVKFMGYAAEEVGLRGSNAIAQSFKNSGKNVVGVMQVDMTNYKTGGIDMQLVTDYSNAAMKQFLVDLFDAYLQPLGLTRGSYTCGYGCSDHASWTSAGYPSAMMFEGGAADGSYNPNIHTANDTLARMGNTAAPTANFAKLGLAFLGELAKTAGTTGNTPPVANFSASVSGLIANFTDSSSDPDGSIVSRSWNFGDGFTSTATNPSRTYAAAGTYTVTLTVTDDDGATHARTSSVTVGGGGPQTYTNASDYPIADNATVDSPITVSGRTGNAPGAVNIAVNIVHTYKGDLKVDLVAPDGTLYNLHNRSGGSADNINTTYSRNLSSEALNGTWKLRVNDNANADTGYLNSWSVTF